MRPHIMHVAGVDPERDAIVAKLIDQADACVHLDPERRGCSHTWLKALGCAAAHDTGEWSLVLSDDADPLPGWQDELDQALEFCPENVLGVTHFGGYGQNAAMLGIPYVTGPHMVWGGGIAYRRELVRPLYSWAMQVVAATDYQWDDVLVMVFQRLTGGSTAMASRAIFDQTVKRSLLGHGGKYRSPATTIANSPAVPWDSVPRSVRVGSRGAPSPPPSLAGIDPPTFRQEPPR